MMQGKIKSILAPFFLMALVMAVFAQVRHFEFLNFDDNVYITENPHVNMGLSFANVKWAFTEAYAGHWHPLSWLSHQLDVTLFGLNPSAHHLMALAWHMLNALLLFYLLKSLFGNEALACLVVALFALHPLRIESVAWVTERKDVLSLCFALASLLQYVRYTRTRSTGSFIAVHVFFILGLLAKPSLMVLPLLFLLLDYWPLAQNFLNWRQLISEKIFLLGLSLLSGLVSISAQSQAGALQSLTHLNLPQRLANAAVAYWLYVGKSLWPTRLSIFYPLQHYSIITALLAGFGLCLFTYLAVKNLKQRPYLCFGFAWFILALLPVIGVVQIGWQEMANRWTYLPHVGVAIALAGGLAKIHTVKWQVYGGVLGLLLVLLTYQTWRELAYWQNSESLFSRAVALDENNFLAHTNLAAAIADQNPDAAYQHYQAALRVNPRYAEAINNMGTIKARQGDYAGASELFSRALNIDPTEKKYRYNLALSAYTQGNKGRALYNYLQLTREYPDYSPAWASLHYMAQHDFNKMCPSLGQDKVILKKELLLTRPKSNIPGLDVALQSLNSCL